MKSPALAPGRLARPRTSVLHCAADAMAREGWPELDPISGLSRRATSTGRLRSPHSRSFGHGRASPLIEKHSLYCEGSRGAQSRRSETAHDVSPHHIPLSQRGGGSAGRSPQSRTRKPAHSLRRVGVRRRPTKVGRGLAAKERRRGEGTGRETSGSSKQEEKGMR